MRPVSTSFTHFIRCSTSVLPLLAAVVIPNLTASAAWEWTNSPTLIELQSPKRNNVFYVGDTVSLKLTKTGASTYAIRDYYGNVVEQGPVPATLQLTPKVTASGWYKVYLYGADQGLPWGNSVGSTTFCILRNDPNFPTMPAVTVQGGGGLMDAVTSSVLGYGPERFKVDNASSPASEIARLDNEIGIAEKYYKPFDPIRKREILIAFPNGTTNLSGVQQIVQHFKGRVKYWEPRNEPNFAMGATAFVNNEQKPFYQLVKSIDPTMKVLGPGAVTVGPNMAGFNQEFFTAGGAQWVDGFSFHAYNCVNGDLNLTRMALDQVNQWLKTYNATGLEKWQTEQGYIAAAYGAYQPRLQGRWTMLHMMVYEQYGIPKEHNHYWYSKSGGYWDNPMWLQNEDNTLNPAAVLLRVYSEELYGTNFSKAYDFGNPGNKLIVGNLFTGPNKQVAAFMTSSETSAQLDLTVTGATSVKLVSPFGAEQILPVVNGKLSLPISELPSYVEFTGTLSVAPMNWGANLALQTGVSAATSGSATHPVDPSFNNAISKTFNGKLDTWYWTQAPNDHLWESNFSSYPGWFELRLPSAQSIDRVVIYTGVLWQMDGSLLDYELQVDQGGQWVSLGHITEPENTTRAYSSTNHTTVDSYYSERCVFTHSFAPVTTQKIRLLVNNTTFGGYANQALRDAGAMGGLHQFSLREIEVYRSGSVVPPPVVPPPVVPSNVAPTAANDSAVTNEGAPILIPVLANDTDSDSGPLPLSISAVSTPAHGTAVVVPGGVLYTPVAGFYGSDPFTYTISDGAATASANVAVAVNSTAKAYDLSSGGLSGGGVGASGGSSRVLADGSWELNATGVGAAGTSDVLRMESVAVTGDFRTVARVQGITASNALARVGLMLRESSQVGARTVMLAVSPSNQNVSGARLIDGGSFAESIPAGADATASLPNAWLMLERTGDVVRLSVSSDGISYRPVASYTLSALGAALQTGLFVSSGTTNTSVRAVVSDWALTRLAVSAPTGQKGLLGLYFTRNDLTLPAVARVDDSINFDWSTGSPHVSIPSDGFSVRWTGQVIPSFTEKYTFYTQSDDGVRLWVNGQLLVDHWNQHAVVEDSGSISLQAGTPYDLKLEYYEGIGSAVARLLWASPSQAKQVIPGAMLRPAVVPMPIGTAATAAVRVLSDGTREFSALGTGLGANAADQGGFLSQWHSGDFQIAIRVRGLTGGSAPRASVMLREGAAPGDRFAAVQVAPDGTLSLVSRTKAGAAAVVTPVSGPLVFPNAWLLIERRADQLSLAVSADDITYRRVGSVSLVGLPQLIQVGAFLGSGAGTTSAKAVLGDYELTPVSASGLTAQYFGAKDLTNLRLTRTDATVDFNWGTGSPDPVLPVDTFSVRWTGKVLPRYSQTYTFSVQSDDGVRLWVNGQLLIDNWTDHSVIENTGSVSLVAGKPYDLKLEYYENTGGATARLLWSSPSQVKQIIPAAQLSTP